MSVFVLLSGFVLGLVHHRWIETRGLRFTYTRLAKRLAALYVCQLTLSLTAVAAGMAGFGHLTWLRPVDGWGQGLVMAVTMSYLPSGGNILLLYMVLMGSAFAVFPLLVRGWWRPVLAASVALYAVSQFAAPDWFYLVAQPSGAHPELGGLADHVRSCSHRRMAVASLGSRRADRATPPGCGVGGSGYRGLHALSGDRRSVAHGRVLPGRQTRVRTARAVGAGCSCRRSTGCAGSSCRCGHENGCGHC